MTRTFAQSRELVARVLEEERVAREARRAERAASGHRPPGRQPGSAVRTPDERRAAHSLRVRESYRRARLAAGFTVRPYHRVEDRRLTDGFDGFLEQQRIRVSQTIADIRAQRGRKLAVLLDQIEDERTPHDGHHDSNDVMNTAEPIDDNDVMVATFGELNLIYRR